MNSTIKDNFNAVLHNENAVIKLQWECDMNIIKVPRILKGTETKQYKIGSKVKTTETSTIKSGLEGKVIRVWKQFGYWYHEVELTVGGKTIARSGDITPA